MPSFPTYQRQQGLGGGSTASYASSSAFEAPGRALQGLGDAVMGAGNQLAAKAERTANSMDDSWFSKARAETTKEMAAAETRAQLAATGDASNHEAVIGQDYARTRETWLGQAPSPRAQQMYDEWSQGFGATVAGRALDFRAKSDLAKRSTDFAEAIIAHAQVVFTDPAQYDVVAKRAMDDLEGAKQWMTPEQEQAARQEVMGQLNLARNKGEIIRDPDGFLKSIGGGAEQVGDGAIDTVVGKIIGVESGGNPNAKNPKSSASGLGQFTNGTWLGTIKQHRPDIAAGKSDAQLLALKTDGALSREMTKYYAQDNAAMLTAHGLPATAGNIYLAHFLGPDGALKTLKASPDASIASIVGMKVVQANPFLQGKTAAQVAAWASGKMGGAAPVNATDPRFAGLTPDQVLGLYQQAETLSGQRQRDATANQNTILAQQKGAFELGISTGDSSVTQQAILASSLSDSDKSTLIDSLNTKRNDTVMAQDALTRAAAGGAFDRYDSKDQKAVGLGYDAAVQGGSIYGQDGKALAALAYMYDRSRIVPKHAMNEIRAGLNSQDPKRMAAAGSVANYLAGIDAGALEASDGGREIAKAATTYKHLTDTLGMTNEEAGKHMVDLNDPEKIRQREALLKTEKVSKAIKDIEPGDITEPFDTGVFDWEPRLGATPEAESIMVADYTDLLRESVVEANGDLDLAKKLTHEKFARIYSPSAMTLDGENTITRYPPERTYPAGPDGTHDYIIQQAKEALAADGINAGEVYLQFYGDTESDRRMGKPPRYQVYYRTDSQIGSLGDIATGDVGQSSGLLTLYNQPFIADPQAARARYQDELNSKVDEGRELYDKRLPTLLEEQADTTVVTP